MYTLNKENKPRNLIQKTVAFALLPLTYILAYWFKWIRSSGVSSLEKRIFDSIGVFPIVDHYYEPLINAKKYLVSPCEQKRNLPGIDFNEEMQLELLKKFNYQIELDALPRNSNTKDRFYFNNGYFESCDAEFYFSIIRLKKPKKIIEIGSGFSTLMAIEAIKLNKKQDTEYNCEIVCIEPFENNWLDQLEVKIIRTPVEKLNISLFESLNSGDILFIDSSHVIRPQGDVLREFLEIIPSLQKGVMIHIHDIFTPHDYPTGWMFENRLWNEQYLLEAFISNNSQFRIIGALNYLAMYHKEEVKNAFPIFRGEAWRYPGSFWLEKNH